MPRQSFFRKSVSQRCAVGHGLDVYRDDLFAGSTMNTINLVSICINFITGCTDGNSEVFVTLSSRMRGESLVLCCRQMVDPLRGIRCGNVASKQRWIIRQDNFYLSINRSQSYLAR